MVIFQKQVKVKDLQFELAEVDEKHWFGVDGVNLCAHYLIRQFILLLRFVWRTASALVQLDLLNDTGTLLVSKINYLPLLSAVAEIGELEDGVFETEADHIVVIQP